MKRICSTPRVMLAGLALAMLTMVVPVAVGWAAGDPDRPNIVLIIGDDIGYRDFGFMGSGVVQTPNLDRLASRGTVFRNGQSSSSLDRPALRTLLTGFHAFQWRLRVAERRKKGIEKSVEEEILLFRFTLPRQLEKRGYQSLQGGRIYEKNHRIAGFTHGIPFEVHDEEISGEATEIGRKTMAPIFEFIDSHQQKPFFLWYAPTLPHLPHDAPEVLRAGFEGRGFSDDAVGYYASIERFDRSVGELIAHLEKRELLENTLVVYVSDNGWDQGPEFERGPNEFDGPRGKGTAYETATRTPIVLHWPGRIPEGMVRDQIVSTVDLFPTLLDYAGAKRVNHRPGYNLRTFLDGEKPWGRKSVIGIIRMPRPNAYRPRNKPEQTERFPEFSYFLRVGKWRFIWNRSWRSMELYDLTIDPDQKRNVAVLNSAQTESYRKQMRTWRNIMLVNMGSQEAMPKNRPNPRRAPRKAPPAPAPGAKAAPTP